MIQKMLPSYRWHQTRLRQVLDEESNKVDLSYTISSRMLKKSASLSCSFGLFGLSGLSRLLVEWFIRQGWLRWDSKNTERSSP